MKRESVRYLLLLHCLRKSHLRTCRKIPPMLGSVSGFSKGMYDMDPYLLERGGQVIHPVAVFTGYSVWERRSIPHRASTN